MVNQPGVAGIRKAAQSAICIKEYFMKSRVLFVFALFIGAALSAQNAADFQYEVENGAVTITGYTGSAKNVTIPGRIDNLPVTAIGRVVFREKQLTGVTIPDSVTTIGEGTFYINQLTSVTIPNGVTAIGRAAFWQNPLTSVTIPANVNITDDPFEENLTQLYTSGGSRAGTYQFRDGAGGFAQYAGDFKYTASNGAVTITGYMGSAKNVTIPGRIDNLPVTVIGDNAFREKQLTSVTIPSSITSIGNSAFENNQLTSAIIPSSVTVIGHYAFSGNQLTSVTIPGSVTSILSWAFANNQLIRVTVPNSVTTIGHAVFGGNRLTSVVIPDSVTAIGDEAFANNPLTSVTIPGSVTAIGWGAFGSTRLASVTIPANVIIDEVSGFAASFPGNLGTVYEQGGSRAGTYRSSDGGKTWARQQ
jgi:hypothetical protein